MNLYYTAYANYLNAENISIKSVSLYDIFLRNVFSYRHKTYMKKRPASTESIANLINNSQQTIRNYEQLLHDVEEAKAILQATPDSNKSSLEFLQLTFEILSGGTAGMHECTIGLCRILQASNVYEKRYHMQTINLNH